jgi:hypothetical protein
VEVTPPPVPERDVKARMPSVKKTVSEPAEDKLDRKSETKRSQVKSGAINRSNPKSTTSKSTKTHRSGNTTRSDPVDDSPPPEPKSTQSKPPDPPPTGPAIDDGPTDLKDPFD